MFWEFHLVEKQPLKQYNLFFHLPFLPMTGLTQNLVILKVWQDSAMPQSFNKNTFFHNVFLRFLLSVNAIACKFVRCV